MSPQSCVIAIDAGTTGVTSILFDRELVPLARAYREFEQRFPAPGQVEHDARAILDAVDTTLGEVCAAAAREGDDVTAIGVTNQRETVFALDLERGEPLGSGIVWQDRRTAPRCAELALYDERPDDARRDLEQLVDGPRASEAEVLPAHLVLARLLVEAGERQAAETRYARYLELGGTEALED